MDVSSSPRVGSQGGVTAVGSGPRDGDDEGGSHERRNRSRALHPVGDTRDNSDDGNTGGGNHDAGAERSGGAWKPSPGSIYPTLQQLEDEGLVRAETDNGRRTFTLTQDGRTYVAEHAEEVAAPWQTLGGETADDDGLKPLIGQVGAAVWQIMAVGSPEQQAQGREALVELRNRLYAILSTDDETAGRS